LRQIERTHGNEKIIVSGKPVNIFTEREWNGFLFIFNMKLASILKMEFRSSNLVHSALVSICGTAEEMFVHVQLINSFWKKLFGIEHIRFYWRNGELIVEEARHPSVHQIVKMVYSFICSEIKTPETRGLRVI